MKLRRINVYGYQFNNGFGTTIGEQDREDGKYVRWTPELQEAWDKQQEQQVIEYKQGLKTECPICKSNVDENYCPMCGQKLKWY